MYLNGRSWLKRSSNPDLQPRQNLKRCLSMKDFARQPILANLHLNPLSFETSRFLHAPRQLLLPPLPHLSQQPEIYQSHPKMPRFSQLQLDSLVDLTYESIFRLDEQAAPFQLPFVHPLFLQHLELSPRHNNLLRLDLGDTSVVHILENRRLPLPLHPREFRLELLPAPILQLDPALTLHIQTSGHYLSLTPRTIFLDFTPTSRLEFYLSSAPNFRPAKFASVSIRHSVKGDYGTEPWQPR